MTPKDLERFRIKVNASDLGCWLWTGAISSTGYGTFWLDGRYATAHRTAYELFRGPVPAGLHLDHLCRVRSCVNPSHLEAVTQRTNTLRGETLPAANAVKTECKRGHEFTPENTYVDKHGGRSCITCRRSVHWPAFVARRKEAA